MYWLQEKLDAAQLRNPFQSMYIIAYYLKQWLDKLTLFSHIDPRRDPVRNVAAGVQEGVIGRLKTRVLKAFPSKPTLLQFLCFTAVGYKGQPGLLDADALRFVPAHQQSSRNRLFTAPWKRDLEGIWKRPVPDRRLAAQLKQALVVLKQTLKDNGVELKPTWALLCKPDMSEPHSQLLWVCFELAGGSDLSGKAKKNTWSSFNKTAMEKRWASPGSLVGVGAGAAKMDTANNNLYMHRQVSQVLLSEYL